MHDLGLTLRDGVFAEAFHSIAASLWQMPAECHLLWKAVKKYPELVGWVKVEGDIGRSEIV